MEKQLNDSDRSRAKAAPSTALRHGFGVRAAEHAQQWHERQARAREQADRLIQSVRASRTDCHTSRTRESHPRPSGETGDGVPTVTVQAMAITLGRSPLELLRSDGPVNRLYAFMNVADASCAIGILCVQSAVGDRLAIDDRALLDALADRLGAALVGGAFAGWREAVSVPRAIP